MKATAFKVRMWYKGGTWDIQGVATCNVCNTFKVLSKMRDEGVKCRGGIKITEMREVEPAYEKVLQTTEIDIWVPIEEVEDYMTQSALMQEYSYQTAHPEFDREQLDQYLAARQALEENPAFSTRGYVPYFIK